MNCQEGMELMQRYVDRDLNGEETSDLMEHVGQCPDCAAMFERLVRLSRGLEQLPHVVPPYSLVDAVLPELNKIQADAAPAEAAEPASLFPRGRRLERRHSRSWITRISGVVALGVVVGLLLLNRPLSEQADNSRQEAASLPEPTAAQEFGLSSPGAGMRISDQNGTASSSEEPAEPETDLAPLSKETAPAAPAPEPQPSAEPEKMFSTQADPNPGTDASSGGMPEAEERDTGQPGAMEALPSESLPPQAADEIPPADSGATPSDPALELQPEEEPPASIMGIMPAVSEEAVSPDGQWKAVLQDGILQLYRMSDNSLVYDQAPDTGMRSELVWSEDSSSVQYTLTDSEGNRIPMALVIQDSHFAEIRR